MASKTPAADRVSAPPPPEAIEEVLVRLLARLLGRSEDEIRSDRGRYAAFHNDDSSYDLEPGWIDWTSLTLTDADDDAPDEGDDEDDAPDEGDDQEEDEGNDNLYGRSDFDLARSVFACEWEKKGDVALRALLKSQGEELYGAQIQEFVRMGRLDPEELAEFSIFGRIRAASDSLLDAARALLLLERFGETAPLRPGPYSKVSRKWAAFLQEASPSKTLRDHLGLFFQTANAARCSGAAYDEASAGPAEDAETFFEIAGRPSFTIVATWDVGEGQGRFFLARIEDDAIPSVPPRAAAEAKPRKPRTPR